MQKFMDQPQNARIHVLESNPMEKTRRFGQRLGQWLNRLNDGTERHRFVGFERARERHLDLQRLTDCPERRLTDHRCAATAQILKTITLERPSTDRIAHDPNR
jgi:hypothetical protein